MKNKKMHLIYLNKLGFVVVNQNMFALSFLQVISISIDSKMYIFLPVFELASFGNGKCNKNKNVQEIFKATKSF